MESTIGRELTVVMSEVFPVYAGVFLYRRKAFLLSIHAQWFCEKPRKSNA